jgi:hypothetical protein
VPAVGGRPSAGAATVARGDLHVRRALVEWRGPRCAQAGVRGARAGVCWVGDDARARVGDKSGVGEGERPLQVPHAPRVVRDRRRCQVAEWMAPSKFVARGEVTNTPCAMGNGFRGCWARLWCCMRLGDTSKSREEATN